MPLSPCAGHSPCSRLTQKFIYCENTPRNIPRTDEAKLSYQPFFLCPFPLTLLGPALVKKRLFLLECVQLAVVLSQWAVGARSGCSCTRHYPSRCGSAPQQKLTRPLSLCPLPGSTWKEAGSPRGGEGEINFTGELWHLVGRSGQRGLVSSLGRPQVAVFPHPGPEACPGSSAIRPSL